MGSSSPFVKRGTHCYHRIMKLCVVLSFCLVLLSFGFGVRGQNENNQDNGQESRGCRLLQGCLGFQHTFDPVGKITGGINHKINKFRTILDIKGKKIRKIFDSFFLLNLPIRKAEVPAGTIILMLGSEETSDLTEDKKKNHPNHHHLNSFKEQNVI